MQWTEDDDGEQTWTIDGMMALMGWLMLMLMELESLMKKCWLQQQKKMQNNEQQQQQQLP